MELTKEIAKKVKETVECGLSLGLGKQIPGEMCIEAAVCYAYGLPHGDNPPCVGSAVRAFKIKLNDTQHSSNKARAECMKYIAIAQLNSNLLDQKEFSRKVTIKVINQIIADLADTHDKELGSRLRVVTDLNEAKTLCLRLKYTIYTATATATANAAICAATYAANAADAAANAAAYAADAAANAAANAAAYAANTARAAACAADARDIILKKAANICLEVLKEMKSEGCEYLYLLDEK